MSNRGVTAIATDTNRVLNFSTKEKFYLCNERTLVLLPSYPPVNQEDALAEHCRSFARSVVHVFNAALTKNSSEVERALRPHRCLSIYICA